MINNNDKWIKLLQNKENRSDILEIIHNEVLTLNYETGKKIVEKNDERIELIKKTINKVNKDLVKFHHS